jgi:hypothetical protein
MIIYSEYSACAALGSLETSELLLEALRRQDVEQWYFTSSNAFRFQSTSSPHHVLAPVHSRHITSLFLYRNRVHVGICIVSALQPMFSIV